MLKARILTAIVLLSVLLPALFWAPQGVWLACGSVIMAVAAWEWGGLLKASEAMRRLFAVLTVGVCAGLSVYDPLSVGLAATERESFEAALQGGVLNMPFYLLAGIFWCGLVPLWLRYKWPLPATWRGWGIGWIVLLPAWLALVQLRSVNTLLLLAVLSVAWVADIAAYFAGRRFGRHKLAPGISPGKTWEGALGALLGMLLFGAVLSTAWADTLPPFRIFLAVCLITAISIIGDLFESLLKRQAGIKDSSRILPGHGGVLDRIDSLTSTLPLSALLLLWLFS